MARLVGEHYDKVASIYHEQYDKEKIMTNPVYPANYFRLQMLLNSFATKEVKKVIEIGVGEGTPLATLAKAGVDTWGCDISHEMVKISQEKIKDLGQDPNKIFWADIEDLNTCAHGYAGGPYDGLMAMGVMPHVQNDNLAISNMASFVKPGGTVFIEFRNSLFSLFTFNRKTVEFIVDDLMRDVDPKLKDAVRQDLEKRCRMDLPKSRTSHDGSLTGGYDAILSKFHNPFEVPELFYKNGFTDLKYLWYHYHAAPPMFTDTDAKTYREQSINLEHETSGWRGYFMCSAFVVEATKI